MKFFILAVGNKMPDWVEAGYAEYTKRLSHEINVNLIEIKPEKRVGGKPVEQLLQAEAQRIRAVLPPNCHIGKMNLNKSEVLFLAQSIGLTIPETLVTTLKEELKNFFLLHDKIITKPIFNGIVVDYDDESYGTMYTALVEEELIKQLPSVFFPSLFQEYINKDIELRIFYLDGHFYSTAVFTQIKNNIIDSRNLEVVENCRSIPYNLPEEIEKKIILLMKSLLLNTGSIDMIKSDSGQYYFLEVNPIGIFDGISLDCNYYLNKKVAEWLAK